MKDKKKKKDKKNKKENKAKKEKEDKREEIGREVAETGVAAEGVEDNAKLFSSARRPWLVGWRASLLGWRTLLLDNLLPIIRTR